MNNYAYKCKYMKYNARYLELKDMLGGAEVPVIPERVITRDEGVRYYIVLDPEPENSKKKLFNSVILIHQQPTDEEIEETEIEVKELWDTLDIYIHKITYISRIPGGGQFGYYYSFKHPNDHEEYSESDSGIKKVKMAAIFELDKSYFQKTFLSQGGSISFNTLKKDIEGL